MKIYDVIGWDVMARSVVHELDRIASEEDDKDVDVHINSGGGFVYDAVAIYNRLKMHPGKVTVYVDGLAASAATIVMLAGEKVVAPEAALFMVHKPWACAIGDADDMRKSADVLDITEGSMLSMYAKKTGMSVDDLIELLKEETWMNAEDAQAFGFIDVVSEFDELEDEDEEDGEVDEEEEVDEESEEEAEDEEGEDEISSRIRQAFRSYHEAQEKNDNLPEYSRVAAGTRYRAAFGGITEQPNEVPAMATKTKTKSPGAPSDDHKAQPSAAAERSRIMAITSLCATHAIADATRDEYIESETSIEEVRGEVLDTLAERQAGSTGSGINPSASDTTVGETEEQKRAEGMRLALEARAGILKGDEAREARRNNQFASMTLFEMCASYAEHRTGTKKNVVGRVLASTRSQPIMASGMGVTHTTSDFGSILQNIATNQLLRGWEEVTDTWRPWTNRGVLGDFKQVARSDLNLYPDLLEVEEGAEYKGAAMNDRGVTNQLATYGRTFGVTRQAIINDDLQAMTKVPMRMGQAAARTVANLVYAVLTANANFDGATPLFDASRNNLHSLDLTADNLATVIAAMRTQTDPDGHATLNIEPGFLIVGANLEYEARKILNAAFIEDNGAAVDNVQRGAVDLIVETRVDDDDDNSWYLTGDGSQHDTVEVAFLDGVETPEVEQVDAWNVDGTNFKVRMDVGVAPMDYRAMQRSDGST